MAKTTLDTSFPIRFGGKYREALEAAIQCIVSGAEPGSRLLAAKYGISDAQAVRVCEVARTFAGNIRIPPDDPVREYDAETLIAALVLQDPFNTTPEILRFLGREKFLDFLDRFGGQTFSLPSVGEFRENLAELEVYTRHVNGESAGDIAEDLGRSVESVERTLKRADSLLTFGLTGYVEASEKTTGD